MADNDKNKEQVKRATIDRFVALRAKYKMGEPSRESLEAIFDAGYETAKASTENYHLDNLRR